MNKVWLLSIVMLLLTGSRLMAQKNPAEKQKGQVMRYFTFEIDGKKVGYYEEKNEGGILYSNARLVMQGNQFENTFWIKHKDGKVIEYKFGDSKYMPFKGDGNTYPTSAISLILPRLKDCDVLKYQSFNEGQGNVQGEATLTRKGNRIEEKINGVLTRYFIIKDGQVITYGWGGTAISKLVSSKAEAVKDTVWEKDNKQK